MARSKKFRPTRRIPDTERSLFEQKLNGRYARTLDRTDLLNLVRGGEDTHLEFKIRLVNPDKIAAEVVAMANSGGGAVIFGVNDQRRVEGLDNPEQVEEDLIDICRNQIKPAILPRLDKVSFDNGTRIVVLQVDDRRAPYQTADHRYYIRVGSTKREADGAEIAALFARSRVATFEDMPMTGTQIEDIDEALVWSYIRDLEGETFREPAGFPTAAAMRDLSLASNHAAGVAPTMAGFLLFGRSLAMERVLPQSRLTLVRYSGAQVSGPVVEQAEFAGNVSSLFDRAAQFIRRYADLWDVRPPRPAQAAPIPARANYSRDTVIEALTNLLVHRDYALTAIPARVLIFDDRLEFINACRTNGTPKKSVEYGSASRPNPRLHHVFTNEEYGIERARRGVPALRRAHFAFTRREPRLSLLNDEFRLELVGI